MNMNSNTFKNDKKVLNGKYELRYANGNLQEVVNYKNGKIDGTPNGT